MADRDLHHYEEGGGSSDPLGDETETDTQIVSATYIWSAPLPRPEVLAKYNQSFPDCAERIVAMAERQALHRQSMELTRLRTNTNSQTTGLWLGFILALIVIGSGAWLVHEGRVEWGAGFISLPLVALVSVFVYGKRDQRKQQQAAEAEARQQNLPFPD